MELDIEKRFFRGAISELSFMPLVDTRSLIQYKNKHNYLWKKMTQYWHMQMHPDDQSFQKFYIQF